MSSKWPRQRSAGHGPQFQCDFQGLAETGLSFGSHDVTMTWIIITAPIMVLAIAIAVLPVLVMSIREARHGFRSAVDPPRTSVGAGFPRLYPGAFSAPDGASRPNGGDADGAGQPATKAAA
jgi:hypothetical protein